MTDPSARQQEALDVLTDDTTNFTGYGGAAFGGKSWLGCSWITNMCLNFEDTGWALGRKGLKNLKNTTLKTLFKVFDDMKIRPGKHYTYNQRSDVITFKETKSEIFLIDMAYLPSDELYTRFGGLELTGGFVDESNQCPLEGINILFTRFGRRGNARHGLIPKMLEGFNPQRNHVYSRYYEPHVRGNLRPTYKFVRSLPTDNPSPETAAYVKGIVDNADSVTIQRLIHGNFEYDDDPAILINYNSMLDSFSNQHVLEEAKKSAKKYITADVAFHGSDLFVVYVWHGWAIIDAVIIEKCDAKKVETVLKETATKHAIPQSNIIYDADGIGSFLKGYLQTARSFNNGAAPIEEQGKKVNYFNLKAQCYYLIAERINNAGVYINSKVADMKINSIFVKDRICDESTCIKKDNANIDGKLKLISKQQMKEQIGYSPDLLDALMMRMFFDLKPAGFKRPKTHLLNQQQSK